MNVVIACGGTGGHLFPGLAVAEVLRQRGHRALIFISEKEIDSLAVRDHVGQFQFEKLPSIGLPRVLSLAALQFSRGFAASLLRCRQIYRQFQPDAVLGMGGFTSTAPLLTGRMFRLPTFVHESNAVPGKANKLNARLSRVVLLGFTECAKYFPAALCRVIGTPIRSSLRTPINQADARKLFGLHEAKPTLLVMGGSQGAHGINQALMGIAGSWKESVQIIHFTGRGDEQVVRAAYDREKTKAYVASFHHRMQEAYSAASFVVARSGAASLSELAYFGLPSLLIPFPAAADDHQTLNAQIFVRAGAALSLKESDINSDTLKKVLADIMTDSSQLEEMSAASRSLATVDAAELLVATLEEQCQT